MRPRAAPVVLVLCAGTLVAAPARADDTHRCKGTKQWYAGKCMYPDEIEALKQHAEPPPPPGPVHPTEDELRAAQQALTEAGDKSACGLAFRLETSDAWTVYLQQHPNGICADTARQRIRDAAAKHPPAPEAPPRPTRTNPLFWTGLGTVLAGGVVWAVAGGFAIARSQALLARCTGSACPQGSDGEITAVNDLAHAATAGVVVCSLGAALTITGLVLPEIRGGKSEGAARVVPVLGPGTLGLAGQF